MVAYVQAMIALLACASLVKAAHVFVPTFFANMVRHLASVHKGIPQILQVYYHVSCSIPVSLKQLFCLLADEDVGG